MTTRRSGSIRSATLAGVGAIVLWSSLALLTVVTAGIPPLQVLATGFGVAGTLGVLRTALQGRQGWEAWRAPPAALALGVAGLFGYHALYFYSLKQAPALEASLINYLWPLLIVLFAALLPGARLKGAHVVGALLGLVAAVLLVTRGSAVQLDPAAAKGYLAALGAAVVWAAYSVLNRRYAHVSSAAIVPVCLGVAALGAAGHVAFEQTVAPSAAQWLVLLAMGLGPVGAAFWLWDYGTKHGDLGLLGSLSYLAPLLSTALLVASGRVQAHWIQAIAVALLMLGAWISLRGSSPRQTGQNPATAAAP